MAGKFHWLLGLALPCSASALPHQLSRRVSKLAMPHLFQMGSSLGPRLGLWSSPLLPHSSPGSAHLAHGPKYQLYVDNSPPFISSPDLSCRRQLEHPSPLNHLHLDVRETLRLSEPKMELLVFSQTHLPQPFPSSILPSVQVNALKSSLTLLPTHKASKNTFHSASKTCPKFIHSHHHQKLPRWLEQPSAFAWTATVASYQSSCAHPFPSNTGARGIPKNPVRPCHCSVQSPPLAPRFTQSQSSLMAQGLA